MSCQTRFESIIIEQNKCQRFSESQFGTAKLANTKGHSAPLD